MNGVPLEPRLVDSSRSALTSSSWIQPVLRVRDEVSAGLFYSHVSWENMFAGWGIAQVLLLVKTPWGSRSNVLTTSLDSHGRLAMWGRLSLPQSCFCGQEGPRAVGTRLGAHVRPPRRSEKLILPCSLKTETTQGTWAASLIPREESPGRQPFRLSSVLAKPILARDQVQNP